MVRLLWKPVRQFLKKLKGGPPRSPAGPLRGPEGPRGTESTSPQHWTRRAQQPRSRQPGGASHRRPPGGRAGSTQHPRKCHPALKRGKCALRSGCHVKEAGHGGHIGWGPLTRNVQNRQIHTDESGSAVARGRGRGTGRGHHGAWGALVG